MVLQIRSMDVFATEVQLWSMTRATTMLSAVEVSHDLSEPSLAPQLDDLEIGGCLVT